MKLLILIFVALTTSTFAYNYEDDNEVTTRGMQGLKLYCDTKAKLDYIHKFEGKPGIDFTRLTRLTNIPVEVLVSAKQLQTFKRDLDVHWIRYEIGIPDVYEAAEVELAKQNAARLKNQGILKYYPKYKEIQDYLKALATVRKTLVKYFTIGNSTEGREISAVKISLDDRDDKPALFIDAGIHAREWIAPTTALYAIEELSLNPKAEDVLKDIDIYVVPVLNPDGYDYTHQSANTRMWRKTRSERMSSSCKGVDANRNFEYKWMTVGASSDPCSETYAGPVAFSEPETVALKNFLSSQKNIKVYLTFHSYGNYLLHPWGWTSALPVNEPTLREVAENAASALAEIRGTPYEIGSSTNVLYPAAGGSDDWAMALGGAELSYTIELPGGQYGFAPPPSEIEPVGKETFEAIKVFAKYVAGTK